MFVTTRQGARLCSRRPLYEQTDKDSHGRPIMMSRARLSSMVRSTDSGASGATAEALCKRSASASPIWRTRQT